MNSTLTALRVPDFRLYVIGQLVSMSGTWMQRVAQGWLIYYLTESEVWLGIVACVMGLPTLIVMPLAGVIVDRFPRRQILLGTQVANMFLATMLALLTFSGAVQVWHVMIFAFGMGLTTAFEAPSRLSLITDIVGQDRLHSGLAINSIMNNSSRIIGPAFAGMLLLQVGPAWCFLLNGLSFVGVILALQLMHVPGMMRQLNQSAPWRELLVGLRFARHHAIIAPLLILAATANTLGIHMIVTLLPAYASESLRSPEAGYAALSIALGIGAVLGGLMNVPLGQRLGRGRLVMGVSLLMPVMVMGFATLHKLVLAVLISGGLGFGFTVFFVTTNTLLQIEAGPGYRGRVLSLYSMTRFGVAPLGALGIGGLAAAIGTPWVMTLCALCAIIIAATIAMRAPLVRQLT